MFNLTDITESIVKDIDDFDTRSKTGNLTQMIGLVLESNGPKVPVGEICNLKDSKGNVVSK